MGFYIPDKASQDVRDGLVLLPPTIAHGFQMLLGKAGIHLTVRYPKPLVSKALWISDSS